MSIIGWDFESVDVRGGPVSSWLLSSDFAARGVWAIGWPEGSGGVYVGAASDVPGWMGGNVLFALPDDAGLSVLAVRLDHATPVELAFAGGAPAFEVVGTRNGVEVFRGSFAGYCKVELPAVTGFSVRSESAPYGVPLEGYLLPAPGLLALACASALLSARLRRRCPM